MRANKAILTDAKKGCEDVIFANGKFEMVNKDGISFLILEVLLDIREQLIQLNYINNKLEIINSNIVDVETAIQELQRMTKSS